MSEYVFSNNKQDFYFDEDRDCIEDILDDVPIVNGVLTIYRGTRVLFKASDFSKGIGDLLFDRAYDKGGEFSDSWRLSVDWQEFNTKLNQFLDSALPAPDFFTVKDIEEVKVRITELDDYWFEFEYINPSTNTNGVHK